MVLLTDFQQFSESNHFTAVVTTHIVEVVG